MQQEGAGVEEPRPRAESVNAFDTEQREPFREDKFLQSASEEIRAGFITKVYGILSVQLLVTALVAAPIVLNDGLKDFVVGEGFPLLMTVMALNMCFVCVMTCCQKTARKFPVNYILLFGFTLTEGVLVGVICTQFQTDSILLAVVATSLLVVGLTLYAKFTKRDFTSLGAYLFAFLLVMFISGFILLFVRSPFWHKVYCCLGILLFSFYLIFDTQKIIGKGALALSVDDYCFAALQLYVDIIQLFIYILRLLGKRS